MAPSCAGPIRRLTESEFVVERIDDGHGWTAGAAPSIMGGCEPAGPPSVRPGGREVSPGSPHGAARRAIAVVLAQAESCSISADSYEQRQTPFELVLKVDAEAQPVHAELSSQSRVSNSQDGHGTAEPRLVVVSDWARLPEVFRDLGGDTLARGNCPLHGAEVLRGSLGSAEVDPIHRFAKVDS